MSRILEALSFIGSLIFIAILYGLFFIVGALILGVEAVLSRIFKEA